MKGRLDFRFRHPGEQQAAFWLMGQGAVLLRHNYHIRSYEMDLILSGPEPEALSFVEVKDWKRDMDFPATLTQTRKRTMAFTQLVSHFTADLARTREDGSSARKAYHVTEVDELERWIQKGYDLYGPIYQKLLEESIDVRYRLVLRENGSEFAMIDVV